MWERERERERKRQVSRDRISAGRPSGGRGELEDGSRYVRFAKTRFARLICGLGWSGRSRIQL